MEQKIKALLGEYAFLIASLQTQIEQLQEKIKEYEDKPERKKSN